MPDTDDVVQSFYGRWSSLYDRLATLPPASSWRHRTTVHLGLERGDTAVEMGCGTGANLTHLRERVGSDGRVVGIDLTRGMLRRARDRGREPGSLLQADATRPPIAPSGDRTTGVDALLGTFVVGLFDDPAAVVAEWCDLVEPGGRVGLLHFHASDRRWAGPANAAYRTLVRISSPNPRRARGAAAHHDARVREAHAALGRYADVVERRTFAGGLLHLVVGRMPEE